VKDRFKGKKGIATVLALIVLAGAFLRLYHFSDWIHFELDQARDARVIVAATEEGVQNLPLLGPRAGGTFLRLGPGFYYLEYVSALVFGSTPAGVGMAMPLLSIFSIAALFFFFRRYFDAKWSLGLALLFAVSLFLVMYGRFAWNPNPLPFFLVFGFYALLRSVDREEARKGLWFLASAASLSFATHLHFVAFVSLPVIVSVFLLIKRPSFPWKIWAGALAIVALFYFPVILNDMATGGANAREFLKAVQGKSNKEQHTLAEQVVRNATNQAAGFWTVLTGYEYAELPRVVDRPGTLSFDIKCDWDCRQHMLSGFSALLLFGLGLAALAYSWWTETVRRKKDFLLLAALWLAVCFALFTPLSYDFAPRFFLLVAPFPFLFFGLIFSVLRKFEKASRLASRIAWIGVVLLAGSNLFFISQRFDELKRAATESFETAPDRILKEKTRVTLEQQEAVLDYMDAFRQANGYPIYMFSEPQHRRALKFLMERRGMQNDVLGFSGGIYEHGNYFLIYRSVSNHEDRLKKYREKYDILDKKVFGTLTVFRLAPKIEAVTAVTQDFSKEEVKGPSSTPDRYTWSEWWQMRMQPSDDEEGIDSEESSEQ
jgi:4-amino-4-deoxy-L-arabinose transferase-like glycosyltransferase